MKDSNPVVVQALSITAVITVIKAFFTLARVMNWIALTDEQSAALLGFLEQALPIVAIWIGAWWAMRRVTPLSQPTDIDGTRLTRPDNTPAIPAMAKMQKEATKINEKIDERLDERRINR